MNVRYTLRSREWLHFVMQHPGRGAPYSIRSLAIAAGFSHHSKVGHLHSGERDDCTAAEAERISEALGVAVLVLFAPEASPRRNEPSTQQ